ncbi:MAG: polysaccharide biosynthesis protein [Lachnospiraceae bacterium]|nr:polysaccharide biosynthesis protein [Lachnospiraceae bacterium]
MGKKNRDSFVKQASILMAAGLIVRIIGMLYRSPLYAIIGELGNGYYGYAYTVYSILLLVSSYSIPMAVSKLMSERIAKRQYRNANKLFRGALLYACIVGGLAALAAGFGGSFLLPAGGDNAVLALQMLAPTIFFSAILGVLRGYFQAHNTMVPTSLSQILEQLVNAVVSVVAAWLLVENLAVNDTETAIYGAAGGTLGTGAGVLAGIVLMLLSFSANQKSIQKRIRNDHTGVEDSYPEIFRTILLMVTPVIFSTCIYNLSSYMDQSIFAPIMLSEGWEEDAVTSAYGVFSGQYMVMINIPIALANAVSTAVLPSISASFAMRDYRETRHKMDEAIQMTMFLCIPAAVGMAVLAFPIMHLLFPNTGDTAGYLLIAGAVSVIFYSLSTITNGVLQGIGKPAVPVEHAAVSLVINVVVLAVLAKFTPLHIYSVLIATIAYSFSMCVLNGRAVAGLLRYRMRMRKIFLVPVIASAVMGVVAYILYYGLYTMIESNVLCLGVAILGAIATYGVLYLRFAGIPREVLRRFPGGRVLVQLATVMGVYGRR